MPPGNHDYVTQRELDARLESQAEMRAMVSRELDRLATGQADLSQQLYSMEIEIVGQMKIANGRTSKLEERMGRTEEILAHGKAHIEDVEVTVHKIQDEGCAKGKKHEATLETLAIVGAVLPPG